MSPAHLRPSPLEGEVEARTNLQELRPAMVVLTGNPTLTLISLKALVDSLMLMLRRGEVEWHRQEGAIAAIELRRRSGDVALMVRGRCATLVVYITQS